MHPGPCPSCLAETNGKDPGEPCVELKRRSREPSPVKNRPDPRACCTKHAGLKQTLRVIGSKGSLITAKLQSVPLEKQGH